jgi:hypothetical protein
MNRIITIVAAVALSVNLSAQSTNLNLSYNTVKNPTDVQNQQESDNHSEVARVPAATNLAAMPLPFTCEFARTNYMEHWTTLDGDGDGIGWTHDFINRGADDIWGDGYVLASVTAAGHTAEANNYLISAPLIFPAAGTYNISFFEKVEIGKTEKLQLLYGTSATPSTMTVLETYEFVGATEFEWYMWNIAHKDFQITTPGNYYFAFRYYSTRGVGQTVGIDKVSISEGVFVGTPDISFSGLVELPPSSCNLTSTHPLSVTVQNLSSADITDFTLTYTVNGGTPVTEAFTNLSMGETKRVTFATPIDYTTVGSYNVVVNCTSTLPAEANTDISNNTISATAHHHSPVAQLPFICDFNTEEGFGNWGPPAYNQWAAYTLAIDGVPTTYYFPRVAVPLISRCIDLDPGQYTFSFTYRSGYGGAGEDFRVAVGLSGTDPVSWPSLREYINVYNPDNFASDNVIVDITSTGTYELAIIPTRLVNLAIFNASLTLTPSHNVRVQSLESPASFARITPRYQVEGNKILNVTLQNLGLSAISGNVKLTMNNNTTPLDTKPFALTTAGEEVTIPLSAALTSLPVGSLVLKATAELTGQTDEDLTNNTLQITKIISDSTFAWDNVDEMTLFVGNSSPLAFGLVYELERADRLTSINLGLEHYEANTDNIGLAVYPINDDLILGEPLLDIVRPRGVGDWYTINFDVPDIELQAGKYYFAVKQLTNTKIRIGVDNSPDGFFYVTNFDDVPMTLMPSHYLHIRPNFGSRTSSVETVKDDGLVLLIYPNPVNDILSVRVDGQSVEGISIYNASGIMVYRDFQINNSEYKLNIGHLATGFYFITVQTNAGVIASKFIVK